jgi:hypothetical protein
VDLDLQDPDNFVGGDELVGYFNEAIEMAEAAILAINEDYFLIPDGTITLVQDQSEYALPTDIYAQKIREITYSNGEIINPVERLKRVHEFYERQVVERYNSGVPGLYAYFIKSVAGAQDKILFTPTPKESGPYIKIAYLRSAARVPLIGELVGGVAATRTSQLATVVDIPEATNYLVQYAKVRCYEKERDPRAASATQALGIIYDALINILTERVPDKMDTVMPDMSHYWEHN